MIKIEAVTLEEAYQNAATSLQCSVTELVVEVVQAPSKGFFGFFKKSAIIVATVDKNVGKDEFVNKDSQVDEEETKTDKTEKVEKSDNVEKVEKKDKEENISHTFINDTMMPASFVSDQDEDNELGSGLEYTADYDDAFDENYVEDEEVLDINSVALEVEEHINDLFDLTCFKIDKIEVSAYDDETLLINFKGEDAALLIGKEGYRYKALSYMIFNWINAKYNVQLRLEIAEFLKNQEESVSRYLTNVYENIDRDGRAQTKILDGVLVQIALKELRERYPDKYVVIRSTKDGLKYIIINDYHNS
jgi:spoIIIJ-associated protein